MAVDSISINTQCKNCLASFRRCRRTFLRVAYNASWIHMTALLLYLVHATAATNQIYSFSDCDNSEHFISDVDGAVVTSQSSGVATSNSINCTYSFQAKVPYLHYLIQFTELDVARKSSGECIDSLTIDEPSSSIKSPYWVIHNFCGTLQDLPPYFTNGKYYSAGSLLRFTWRTGQRLNRGQDFAFKVTLTAVTEATERCTSLRGQYACAAEECISELLLCDGVPHCTGGQDELENCPHPNPLGAAASLTATQEYSTTKEQPTNGNGAPTTPRPFLGNEEIFLWLPLVVVVIFTAVMIGLITIGRRKEANNAESTNANNTNNLTTSASTTTKLTSSSSSSPPRPSTTTSMDLFPEADFEYSGAELVYMVVLFTIFIIIVVACLLFARKDSHDHSASEAEALGTTSACADDRNGLSVDVSGNNAYEPEPGQPHTPPPSYSILERQISYVSHISQSSSQIEEPPDYTDALEYPEEGGRPARSASAAFRDRHRSNSAGSRLSRLRGRLFSRSVSATEPRYRRRNDSSASTETPDIAENPTEIAEGLPGTRESDSSDVFVTFTAGPQDHSTPHPSSTSSQSTTQTSVASPRVNLNSSHLTTISSIDEGDLNASTPSIFDHINRLNEPDSEIDDLGDIRGFHNQNEASSGSRESGSATGSGGHISEMALLTNDGAPNDRCASPRN